MDKTQLDQYRDRLLETLLTLQTLDTATQASRETVQLDQQSVGRLSRMDAMQQQAMANATFQRRQLEKKRLSAALERLDAGEFGYCLDCGDLIGARRLELEPTTIKCISCARG